VTDRFNLKENGSCSPAADGVTGVADTVPEPASLLLLGASLSGSGILSGADATEGWSQVSFLDASWVGKDRLF